jgi:hypothetical protein
MSASDAEIFQLQIDKVDMDNTNDDPGIGFVQGNVNYDKLEDKIPYITGSFTGWRYRKMIRLDQFTREIDKEFLEPIELGKR